MVILLNVLKKVNFIHAVRENNTMSKILCLETATTICSVALFDGHNLISSREIDEGYRHSAKLTVFIEEVLNDANISVKDLSAVVVSNGPGSYTGLRIGMSVAKGLCYASDVPMISLSTLEIMAARAVAEIKTDDAEALFCPMIDARRMEVYCALYDTKLNILKAPAAVIVDGDFFKDVEQKVFYFGDGAAKCRDVLNEKFIYAESVFPSALYMGSLAVEKFTKSVFEDASLAEPVYLKEFLAGAKKN